MFSDTFDQRVDSPNVHGDRNFGTTKLGNDDGDRTDDEPLVDDGRLDQNADLEATDVQDPAVAAREDDTDEQPLVETPELREPELHGIDVDAGDASVISPEATDSVATDADVADADVVDADVVDADMTNVDTADTADLVEVDTIDANLADVDAVDVVDAEAAVVDVDLSDGPAGTGGDMLPGAVPVDDHVGVPDRSELKARWQRAQLGFIDDPAGSAEAAAAIAAEALEAHIDALRSRLADLGAWQTGGQVAGVHDTEVLRTAVHGYRTFVEQVVGE